MSFNVDTIALPWDQNVELAPGLAGSTWSGTLYTWSDALSIEIVLSHGATDPRFTDWFQRWQNTKTDEVNRFVTLLSEINGKEYLEKRKLKNKKIELTVGDINLIADNMRSSGIRLSVKNIEIL